MKIVWASYANDRYATIQSAMADRLHKLGIFDDIHAYRQWDVDKKFFDYNLEIFEQERGAGYWLWKPFLIMKSLKRINEGDCVLYMDCGDALINENKNVYDFIRSHMSDKDILLTLGAHPNRKYTKRDCFVIMGCDEPKYHDATQLEAGMIVVKKTRKSMDFIAEWLMYCQVAQIITDSNNICGLPNFEDFVDHRHDQSILSLLQLKHNVYAGTEMRSYIYCNQKTPE